MLKFNQFEFEYSFQPYNIGHYHFIWRVPDNFDAQAALSENEKVIQFVKTQIPHYHSRAMCQDFINMYGRLTSTTAPYVLRDIYKVLTNDQSASRTTDEKEIDMRIKEGLESEDPDITDLCEFNGRKTDNYKVFWEHCESYLRDCTAVHERRHDSVVHMAKAISVRDLIAQVKERCPEGTPILSESWVRFNFCPQNPRERVSKFYHGRLGVKRVAQK